MEAKAHRPRSGPGRAGDEGEGTSGISKVGVVIATRDRAVRLLTTLEHLHAHPEPPPIVVVDNASSDGTPEVVSDRFPSVTVLRLPANAGAHARTLGCRLLRAPYVAFCDDDSWYAPEALGRAVARLDASPALAGVVARVLVGPPGDLDPVSRAMADSPLNASLVADPDGARGVTGFLACALVARRRAVLACGGFEARLVVGGEEEPLALELLARGWQLIYAPEVVVHHHPSSSDAGRRHRAAREATNAVLSGWWRLSAGAAALRTAHLAGRALRQPSLLPATRRALVGLPWALARRRPISTRVEAALHLHGASATGRAQPLFVPSADG
jgi:GT2 family glycosyltransferase